MRPARPLAKNSTKRRRTGRLTRSATVFRNPAKQRRLLRLALSPRPAISAAAWAIINRCDSLDEFRYDPRKPRARGAFLLVTCIARCLPMLAKAVSDGP